MTFGLELNRLRSSDTVARSLLYDLPFTSVCGGLDDTASAALLARLLKRTRDAIDSQCRDIRRDRCSESTAVAVSRSVAVSQSELRSVSQFREQPLSVNDGAPVVAIGVRDPTAHYLSTRGWHPGR